MSAHETLRQMVEQTRDDYARWPTKDCLAEVVALTLSEILCAPSPGREQLRKAIYAELGAGATWASVYRILALLPEESACREALEAVIEADNAGIGQMLPREFAAKFQKAARLCAAALASSPAPESGQDAKSLRIGFIHGATWMQSRLEDDGGFDLARIEEVADEKYPAAPRSPEPKYVCRGCGWTTNDERKVFTEQRVGPEDVLIATGRKVHEVDGEGCGPVVEGGKS